MLQFKCEECGAVWVPEQWSTSFCDPERRSEVAAFDEACPNCGKSRYGPLTRELVAEALYEAARRAPYSCWTGCVNWADLSSSTQTLMLAQADFVLRLCKTIRELDPEAGYTSKDDEYWREKLLCIVKE